MLQLRFQKTSAELGEKQEKNDSAETQRDCVGNGRVANCK